MQETIHVSGHTVGQKFGKYEIVEELGRGAMGVVYKARDPLIGRLVALKTVMPGLLSDPDLLKRFYREAQSAGRLQHPNIVTIHDLGEADGLPYIAMEMVEGESLQRIIARRTALPLATKLRIMVQICNGLGYAHQHGVVHRDIKPGNILVTPNGSVKVVDFGIVHLADTGMTQSGMILGTVSYMSPEQLRGEQVDRRSDIFSVGIVMYELLAYQKAFDGSNVTAIMLKIASEEPTPLTDLIPGLPSALSEIVRKCLRKDREDRFQTLEDLAFEIDPFARKLQREVVDAMVEESRELVARSEFTRAEEVLRSALALDSSHDVAKGLMSEVQTSLRRLKLSARVQQFMTEGQRLLDERKYPEAAKAFEEVLKLDSQHGTARTMLRQASEAAVRAADVRKRVVAARRALSEGDLTLAESELRQALDLEATETEVISLLEKIRQERIAQEKRLRLREGVAGARDLMRMDRDDDARLQLEVLHTEFPDDTEVDRLLAALRQKIAEREQVKQAFDEVKSLLEQQRFQEAMDRAETVRFQFPKEAESTRLYNFARTESELAGRRQKLELEVTALQEQIKGGKYAEAIALGERLQREFPASVEVARLLMLARSEEQAAGRVRQAEEARKSVQTLWDEGRREEAARKAESALEMFPDDPGLTRTLAAVRDEIVRQAVPATSPKPPEAAASATLLVPPGGPQGSTHVRAAHDPGGLQPVAAQTPGEVAESNAGSLVVPAVREPKPSPARRRVLPIAVAAALLILIGSYLGYIVVRRRPAAAPPAPSAAPTSSAESQSPASAGAPGGETSATTAALPSGSATPATEAAGATASPPAAPTPPNAPSGIHGTSATREPGAGAPLPKPGTGPSRVTATATSPATGTLVVQANVDGARILMDGHDTGETAPHTFPAVTASHHVVSLIKDGYSTASGGFDVPEGGSATASLQLQQPTGLLEFITSPTGATVTIDDKPYGTTPIKTTIVVGKHTFSVTAGNRTQSGTLIVQEGYNQKEVEFPQ